MKVKLKEIYDNSVLPLIIAPFYGEWAYGTRWLNSLSVLKDPPFPMEDPIYETYFE